MKIDVGHMNSVTYLAFRILYSILIHYTKWQASDRRIVIDTNCEHIFLRVFHSERIAHVLKTHFGLKLSSKNGQ